VTIVKGTIQNGQVILPMPADLTDGMEVRVIPMRRTETVENDEPMTVDEIAGTMATMENFEALEFTVEDRAAIEAQRQAHRTWEKSRFFDHAERLREMWE
jgi:hypothetical protein